MRGFDCLVAGIASVIVVAAVATQQADASPKPPTCDSYPDTVVANGQVKVFRIGWRRATVRRPEGFYACDVRSRRLRFLGSDAVDARDVRLIRLAGRYVAFEYHACQTIYCVHAIVRLNMRNGKRRAFDEPPIGQSEADDALDLEATPRGNVVWIRAVTDPAAPRFDVVHWDGTEVTVLDSGPVNEVRARSLAVSGGQAYWFARGQAKSAIVD